MGVNGLLTDVRWEWTGTELTADVLAGTTVLPVLDPESVTAGESVWIAGEGPYEVIDTDPDAATFTVEPALVNPAEDGTEVACDVGGLPGRFWVAEVVLPDAEEPIEVPLTIQDLAVMPEGNYDPPRVIIISDDYMSVIDLPGQDPVISGGYIPPGTIPAAEPLYTWIKYADSPTAGMSDDPTGKMYMGIAYNKINPTESTNYADYEWAQIQGAQGVPGEPGTNGQVTYTWIKYANTSSGEGISDDPTGKTYVGIAVNKTTAVESTNPVDYTWSLMQGPQGPQGPQGIQGPAGADGTPRYIWLKYADTPTTGMSDSPTGKTYMGIAYNKTTATESSVYADYEWSLIRGPQGSQGVPGPAGADGTPRYIWLKYADTPTSGMSDSPTGKTYMGVAYNETTATESSTYADYEWSLIKGEQGIAGPAGADGKPTYTWVKYAKTKAGSTSTNLFKGETVNYGPTVTPGVTYAGKTWSRITNPAGGNRFVRYYADLADVEGNAHTAAWEVANDGAVPITLAADWCDTVPTTVTTLAPGATAVITASGPRTTYTSIYRFGDLGFDNSMTTAGVSFLVRAATIVKTSDYSEPFDGDSVDTATTKYDWTGTPGASKSTRTQLNDAPDYTTFSDSPDGATYIGFAYNKLTATESTVPSDYQWSLIQGPQGDQGVPGPAGADGQPTYTWIKYAQNEGGRVRTNYLTAPNGMSTDRWLGVGGVITAQGSGVRLTRNAATGGWSPYWGTGGNRVVAAVPGEKWTISADIAANYTAGAYPDLTFMDANGIRLTGSASKLLNLVANVPQRFFVTGTAPAGTAWVGFAVNLGAGRPNGATTDTVDLANLILEKTDSSLPYFDGSVADTTDYRYDWTGTPGASSSTQTRLTDTPILSTMSDSPDGAAYIGMAFNKTTATESTNPADYQWSLIQGPSGEPGVPGPPGADGQPTYTWIKYADSSTGAGLSDSPTGKAYIGIAPNKPTSVESTLPGDYTWSLMLGPQGNQGIPGPAGADGKTTYTWVKYADSATGAGLSDDPTGKTYLGLAYNKTTPTESTNPADYQWALFRGPQGIPGPAGTDGVDGNVTDGQAPPFSPTPEVVAGIGAFFLRWAPTPNKDLVQYEVHVHGDPAQGTGFAPTAATLYSSTPGYTMTVRNLAAKDANGIPVPFSYDTPYYFKIVAKDADGSAPAGGGVTAVLTQITGPDIAARTIVGENLVGSTITGDLLSSEMVLSSTFTTGALDTTTDPPSITGARIELGPMGLRVVDANGNDIFSVPLDSVESSFLRSNFDMLSATVQNDFTMMGLRNQIAVGGALALSNGVTAPAGVPQVSWAYDKFQLDTSREVPPHVAATGFNLGTFSLDASQIRSLAWDDANDLWTVLQQKSTGFRLWRFSPTGAIANNIVSGRPWVDDFNSNLLASHTWGSGSGLYAGDGLLYKRDGMWLFAGGGTVNRIPDAWMVDVASRPPCVGYDATQGRWMIVQSNGGGTGKIQLRRFAVTAWSGSGAIPLATSAGMVEMEAQSGLARRVNGCYFGPADFGGNRLVVNTEDYQPVFVFNGATLADDDGSFELWGKPGASMGLAFNGVAWTSVDALGGMTTYSKWNWLSKNTTGYLGMSAFDSDIATETPGVTDTSPYGPHPGQSAGQHETPVGNVIPFVMQRRSKLLITVPATQDSGGPDDPDKWKVYWTRQVNPPTTAAEFKYVGLAGTPAGPSSLPLVTTDPIGGNPPGGLLGTVGARNNYPSGIPAILSSAATDANGNPLIELKGSGAGRTGPLSWGTNGVISTSPVPVGVILPTGSSIIPPDFLECNGQAVSRTAYPELFIAIGTSFGAGDGSTTFNVPDAIRRPLIGRGGGISIGRDDGIPTASASTRTFGHRHSANGLTTSVTGNLAGTATGNTDRPTAGHTHAISGSTGQSGFDDIPNLCVAYIIKAKTY